MTDADGGSGRFWPWVGAALGVAVAVRLAYVAGSTVPSEPGFLVTFDPIYYHRQARAVADGLGFVAPYRTDGAPSADHPPLLVVVLALASKLGLSSFGAHRILTALIGAAVVPLVALLGRRLAGPRVGIVAAGLAAVAPVLWANDGQLMPEPLYAVAVAGALLLAHRLWDGDTVARVRGLPGVLGAAAVLGGVIALAGLARGEGLALLGFTVVPVALWAPGLDGWRPRVAVVVVATVACAAVLAPWLAYNAGRFEERVLLSASADSAFAGANCEQTYAGPQVGGWSSDCFAEHSNQTLEESVFSARIRDDAEDHVRQNLGALPRVVAARIGRLWGVFQPSAGVELDVLQNRPRPVSWAGLATLALLVPLGVVGAVRLRRAGRPVVLLLALPVMVTVVAAAFYGNPRFRVPADLALVVLAAVALEGWWARARRYTSSDPAHRPVGVGSADAVPSSGGRQAPDQDAQRPGAGAGPERGRAQHPGRHPHPGHGADLEAAGVGRGGGGRAQRPDHGDR